MMPGRSSLERRRGKEGGCREDNPPRKLQRGQRSKTAMQHGGVEGKAANSFLEKLINSLIFGCAGPLSLHAGFL